MPAADITYQPDQASQLRRRQWVVFKVSRQSYGDAVRVRPARMHPPRIFRSTALDAAVNADQVMVADAAKTSPLQVPAMDSFGRHVPGSSVMDYNPRGGFAAHKGPVEP
jgi:hypothetical protein